MYLCTTSNRLTILNSSQGRLSVLLQTHPHHLEKKPIGLYQISCVIQPNTSCKPKIILEFNSIEEGSTTPSININYNTAQAASIDPRAIQYTHNNDAICQMTSSHCFLYASPHTYHDHLGEHHQREKRHTASLLYISSQSQTLTHIENQKVICTYQVATGKNGLGQTDGSYQTPLGLHCITDLIGDKQHVDTFFKSRVAIGSYKNPPDNYHDEQDWILSRIIRFQGLETSFNQGSDNQHNSVDSFDRYIYIHGTPDEVFTPSPSSHGCIRMKPHDVIHLFGQITTGCYIYISTHDLITHNPT